MNHDKNITCCPYGTYRGNEVVECYHFGLITVCFCRNCKIGERHNITSENEG